MMREAIFILYYPLILQRQINMKTSIKLREEYIKLGQAVKAAGFVDSGVEAKIVIQDGLVKVNGEVDTRRGRKLVAGDKVEFEGNIIDIEE